MNVEELIGYDAFRALSEPWNQALEHSPSEPVALTHEWLSCWWEAFGTGAQMHGLLLYEGDRLEGALPLMRKRGRVRGIPARVLSLALNGHTPEGGVLEPRQPFWEHELASYLCDVAGDWDVMHLERLPAGSALLDRLVTSFTKAGLRCRVDDAMSSPIIDATGTWDEFRRSRSRELRKDMRRARNRFEREKMKVERIAGSDLPDAVDEMFAVSGRSWKGAAGSSIQKEPGVESFYRRLAERLGHRCLADLWLLRHKEHAIAFEFLVYGRGVAYPIRADFDEEFRRLGPGFILQHHVVRELFDDPRITTYHCCGRTYRYLMRWATSVRPYSDLWVYHSGAYSRVLHLIETQLLPAGRALRDACRARSQSSEGPS